MTKYYQDEETKIFLTIDSIERWDRQSLNKFQQIIWTIIRKLTIFGLKSIDKTYER